MSRYSSISGQVDLDSLFDSEGSGGNLPLVDSGIHLLKSFVYYRKIQQPQVGYLKVSGYASS